MAHQGFLTEFVGREGDLKRLLLKEAITADPPRNQDGKVRFYFDPHRVLMYLSFRIHPRRLPSSRY